MTTLVTQSSVKSSITNLKSKMALYWPLTKPSQSGLLLATGLAGYMSARCPLFYIIPLLWFAARPLFGNSRQHRAQHVVGP